MVIKKTLDSIKSSMYSVEKDLETIVRKLFVESRPYSDELKRLLVINTNDCLDQNNQNYQKIVEKISVKDIIEGNYLTTVPKVKMSEHEEYKSYIVVSFDYFSPTSNPQYRDCTVAFDIICPLDYWDLGNYQLRPIKIMGIIDGILNGARLSGIGTLDFMSAKELIINEDFAGYTLMFRAIHGNDDNIAGE